MDLYLKGLELDSGNTFGEGCYLYRILIVEDEKEIRLRTETYAGKCFCTRQKLLRIFLQSPALWKKPAPDLILLDIQLPGTDGLKVCRDIRKEVGCGPSFS